MSVSVIRKLKNEVVVWGARVLLCGAFFCFIAALVHASGEANWRDSFALTEQFFVLAICSMGALCLIAFTLVVLCVAAGGRVHAALDARDDTRFGASIEDYLRIAKRLGFEQVSRERVDCPERPGEFGHLYILWNAERGILLKFDTYWEWCGGKPAASVNGGNFYYNWMPNDPAQPWGGVTSSGGYRKRGDDLVWIGHHDCREALAFHVEELAAAGRFVTPWVERPFLWLLSWADTKGDYDHNEINARRIAALPEEVRNAITPRTSDEIDHKGT